MQSKEKNGAGLRRRRQRGQEMIEYTMVLLPLLCIMFVLLDVAWGIFVKATLQYAVHAGLRHGVTITGTQASAYGETLTQLVKDTVQKNSLGILTCPTCRSYIHVNFLGLNTATPPVVVNLNSVAGSNVAPNLMQVSVDSYPLPALAPRFFGWAFRDQSASAISAIAADEIEPSSDVPTMGAAP